VILAPQSVGPIARPVSRAVARHVLGKVPYLCARESYSWDFLALGLGLPERNVYRTGDSAFWNDRVEDNRELVDRIYSEIGVSPEKPVFGMTVVGWSFPKSRDPKADYDRYTTAVARAADHMSETYGLTPVIFNQVSEDLPTAYEIQKKAKHAVVIDAVSREPDILRALITRSKVFLGTRFHSCIFSMMAGRPTFAIAYLPKTEYIMNDLKLSHRHTPIDAIDYDYMIKQISSDCSNLAAAEAEIHNAVKVYQQNFTRLQDILGLIGRTR
jgi:colanic acid/amylovoran biosynthesis protein